MARFEEALKYYKNNGEYTKMMKDLANKDWEKEIEDELH